MWDQQRKVAHLSYHDKRLSLMSSVLVERYWSSLSQNSDESGASSGKSSNMLFEDVWDCWGCIKVTNQPQRNTKHALSPQNPQQCSHPCCQCCSILRHMSDCTPCGQCCGQCQPTNPPNCVPWSTWSCVKGEELLEMRIIKAQIWLVPTTNCDAISFRVNYLVVIPVDSVLTNNKSCTDGERKYTTGRCSCKGFVDMVHGMMVARFGVPQEKTSVTSLNIWPNVI